MRFSAATLLLSALPWLASSAPVTAEEPRINFDAIVIGGGPSGLAATSGLARVRRNVLMIDSGVYRNGMTRHMHDVPGLDGKSPAEFRYMARQQLRHYSTVAMTNGTVTKIERMDNDKYFKVTAEFADGKVDTRTTRTIILATGVRDLVPNTPGLQENWAQGIYWCPWCDGHEHADQSLGFLATLDKIPGMAEEVLTLNNDLVAFVNGTDTPQLREEMTKKNPDWEKILEESKVKIDNRPIKSIERLMNGTTGDESSGLPTAPEQDLFRVHFTTGEPVERAALMTSFGHDQLSDIGEKMGVQMQGNKLGVNPEKGMQTSIHNVFAVGDANSDNVTNVPHAFYSGKRTAVFLHVQLEREEAERMLSAEKKKTKASKRSLEEEVRSVWERMNGDEDDLMYAGKFDQ